MTANHPLHTKVSSIIDEVITSKCAGSCIKIPSNNCGGSGTLPFHKGNGAKDDPEYCQVDCLILKGREVRTVIEIEESAKRPIDLFGKALASASSDYCRKGFGGVKNPKLSRFGGFIQVIGQSESESAEKSGKSAQWDDVTGVLKETLGNEKSKLRNYFLIYGKDEEFNEGQPKLQFIDAIKRSLGCDYCPRHEGLRTAPDPSLPFFTYGIFKPGELGFNQIGQFVNDASESLVEGNLWIRDGLPLLDLSEYGNVRGNLIHFKTDKVGDAFDVIMEMEPTDHYYWAVIETDLGKANCLLGIKPKNGSRHYEDDSWNGKDDPLFTKALVVIDKTLKEYSIFDEKLDSLFHLEMAYMLLWSSIERFTTLHYRIGGNPMERINHLADNKYFQEILRCTVKIQPGRDPRSIYRTDDPGKKITLDPSNPKKALSYYYQIRSNITHRGKAVGRDFEILRNALSDLLCIHTYVVKESFGNGQLGSEQRHSQLRVEEIDL